MNLWNAVQAGDHKKAREIHEALLRFWNTIAFDNLPANIKFSLRCRAAPPACPRMPMPATTPEQAADISRELDARAALRQLTVKKILNSPQAYVDEMLDGLVAAHPEALRRLGDDGRVIVRAGGAVKGKVGIVTGGGSGHLPVFLGYVGDGLLDACAVGNVFAGPRVGDCQAAAHAADGGAGVLQLYGNYGGDRMNFDMAQEFLELEGMEVASVRVADDVASAPKAERAKRRGVAGMVYAFKIAGARAAEGASLKEVTAAAQKAGSTAPLDRRGAHALRGARVRQAQLRHRRRRDRVRHGHPWRAGHLARPPEERRRAVPMRCW